MSDILAALKFCAGSVAKKAYVPELTHFCIENGRVKGFNGTLALSTPIAFDFACKPEASKLIDVIANCDETIQMTLTAAGRLSVKSGAFKAIVKCIEGDTPHQEPEGDIVQLNGEAFFEGIKTVAPFIGEDAARRWCHGILFKDQSLYCTNNVILVQYWIGVDFPRSINLPRAAVKEMLRIGEAPLYAQVGETSVTFHYEGERWLRTQLYSTEEWPDIGRLLNAPSQLKPIDPAIFEGLEKLKKLVEEDGTIFFNKERGLMTTHEDADEGGSYALSNIVADGKFNIQMLQKLDGVAEHIDFGAYPQPCAFQKGMLRGVIVGKRPKAAQVQE